MSPVRDFLVASLVTLFLPNYLRLVCVIYSFGDFSPEEHFGKDMFSVCVSQVLARI